MKKSKTDDAPEKKPAKPPKVKPLLKGFVYAYRVPGEDDYQIDVEKAKAGVDETGVPFKAEGTYVVVNDTCDCPAGEHANICKHLEMVQGRFKGNRFERDEAETLVDEFVTKFRNEGASVAIIGSLAFTNKEFITRADVLVFQEGKCSAELVMYLEFKSLLVKARFLPTQEAFDKTHSGARIAWMNQKRFI